MAEKPLPPLPDLVAGDAFRDTLLQRADVKEPFPLWHGWAIMDAFLAGAEYARSRSAAPEDGFASRWRDTKVTVPGDGEDVLGIWGVGVPGKVDISTVHYYSGRWHDPADDEDDFRAPDFWMPLPPAPQLGEQPKEKS